MLEVEKSLSIRLPEYENMVKACGSYASMFIGDLSYTFDLNETNQTTADVEMLGSTDDISDLDLNDIQNLIDDDPPSRDEKN